MERWLTKPRVLFALCGVLLTASLNRQDPMVYGMFLFLGLLTTLGYVVPWLSLRGLAVTAALPDGEAQAIEENQASPVRLQLARQGWWPAFLVDIETHWEWAGHTQVLTHTVPVVRRGQPLELGGTLRFPCRGHHRLERVTLSSGFPLGLLRSTVTLRPTEVRLLVLPKAQAVQRALDWNVSPDPLGEYPSRRVGTSNELGFLRLYEAGEYLGRINWRASARACDLVVQHFRDNASPMLRLVVDLPGPGAVGDPESPSEQALRLAVGLADQAHAEGVRLRVYATPGSDPLQDPQLLRHTLAQAGPNPRALAQNLQRASNDLRAGEALALVVGGDTRAHTLLQAIDTVGLQAWAVHVHIATSPGGGSAPAAHTLAQALWDRGLEAHVEAP